MHTAIPNSHQAIGLQMSRVLPNHSYDRIRSFMVFQGKIKTTRLGGIGTAYSFAEDTPQWVPSTISIPLCCSISANVFIVGHNTPVSCLTVTPIAVKKRIQLRLLSRIAGKLPFSLVPCFQARRTGADAAGLQAGQNRDMSQCIVRSFPWAWYRM